MNWNKQRAILEYIRHQGGVPVDGTGRRLSADETLAWFGLDELLPPMELAIIRREIVAMIGADDLVEQMRWRSLQ